MRITLATTITLLRLFLIVPILLLLAHNPVLGGILLILALLTDTADGYIARKTGTVTDEGAFLDHLADKLLVHLVLLYFVAAHGLSAIAYGIFLARDFTVLGIRHLATQRGEEIASMSLGKIKFVGQSLLLVLLAATLAHPAQWLATLADIALWAAVVLAVVSAVQIGKKGYDILK